MNLRPNQAWNGTSIIQDNSNPAFFDVSFPANRANVKFRSKRENYYKNVILRYLNLLPFLSGFCKFSLFQTNVHGIVVIFIIFLLFAHGVTACGVTLSLDTTPFPPTRTGTHILVFPSHTFPFNFYIHNNFQSPLIKINACQLNPHHLNLSL